MPIFGRSKKAEFERINQRFETQDVYETTIQWILRMKNLTIRQSKHCFHRLKQNRRS